MKIVYISNSIIPSRTANSIHVMKMCQAFATAGHEVVLFAPNRENEYEENITDIYKYYGVQKIFEVHKLKYVDKQFWRPVIYSYAILKELRKIKPDIVYGRYLYGVFLSSFFYRTFFEAHAPMSTFLKKKLFNRIHKHSKLERIIVISEALKNIFLETKDISKSKLLVAHDGADEVLDTSIMELKGLKEQLNIGYVGHLYKGRGVEIILELAKKFKNINFHIVGGTKDDILYWKSIIQKEHIDNFYLYGHVSPTVAVQFRNSFDIVLAPYSQQVSVAGNSGDTSAFMSPLKIFEYMAHKKAIITSDLPVLREILSEESALLVNPEDIESWIEAVNKLLDKNFREMIASRAYKDFINNYRWKDRAIKVIGKS